MLGPCMEGVCGREGRGGEAIEHGKDEEMEGRGE